MLSANMRTRFAPSPTGFLHVGGLRTALYAYLIAHKSGGKFLLRVEDTDQARSVPGAVENILQTLQWAGIAPDEGVMLQPDGSVTQCGDAGPYIQSERVALYKKYAQELIDKGHAYYAFDTPDDIEAMRRQMMRDGYQSPNYSASVRMTMKNSLSLPADEVQKRIASGESYAVRFMTPENETVACDDEIRGRVEFQTKILDDQVLLKGDGFPTYHLAHVVDDHLMKIDIVIRGEEWLSSTPKHLLLFKAFGWEPPRYAHVPLLLNKDRSKLSKRQNDVAADDYRVKGYLPEALINFLAMLGWNPGTEQELFSLDELVTSFSLDRVQKAGAIFDLTKLDWLQGQWMRAMPDDIFTARLQSAIEAELPVIKNDADFQRKVLLIKDRVQFFREAASMLRYFYEDPAPSADVLASKKQKVEAADLPKYFEILIATLTLIDAAAWNEEALKQAIGVACEANQLKLGQLLWPLRAALTGLPFSPGAYEVAALLGRDVTLRRLAAAHKAATGA